MQSYEQHPEHRTYSYNEEIMNQLQPVRHKEQRAQVEEALRASRMKEFPRPASLSQQR